MKSGLQESFMQNDLEQQIRERAYHLWVANGCHDGEADHYWLAAEREVLAAYAATAPAAKPKSGRRAANANVETPATELNKAAAKTATKPRRRAAS
jgi:Protein of unknown function (DUF2934)